MVSEYSLFGPSTKFSMAERHHTILTHFQPSLLAHVHTATFTMAIGIREDIYQGWMVYALKIKDWYNQY